jgi:hypothetical protein
VRRKDFLFKFQRPKYGDLVVYALSCNPEKSQRIGIIAGELEDDRFSVAWFGPDIDVVLFETCGLNSLTVVDLDEHAEYVKRSRCGTVD